MNKFYLIDKPSGITSFDVIRVLRKKLHIKKIGHTGTLDPLATGLLLIATGNYTKLIPYFEKDTKEYEFEMSLNGKSPSFDMETEINFLSNERQEFFKKNIDIPKIKEILEKKFYGEIEQIPPKYSALKIGGIKYLDLVKSGVEFEVKKRKVNIFNIKIVQFKYPNLRLKSLVSAGTYIRSIANDLGEILKTGGYITKLRRTKIGKLGVSQSQKLEDFSSENYLNVEELFLKEKIISLENKILEDLNNGKRIKYESLHLKPEEIYFVKNNDLITNVVQYKNKILFPIKNIIL